MTSVFHTVVSQGGGAGGKWNGTNAKGLIAIHTRLRLIEPLSRQSQVQVWRDGQPAEKVTGERFDLLTRPGEQLRLEPCTAR